MFPGWSLRGKMFFHSVKTIICSTPVHPECTGSVFTHNCCTARPCRLFASGLVVWFDRAKLKVFFMENVALFLVASHEFRSIYASPSNASSSRRLVGGRSTLKHELRLVNFYDSLDIVIATPLFRHSSGRTRYLSAAGQCVLQTKRRLILFLFVFS